MRFALIPVAKPRMTQKDVWSKRPCVMRYRAFKDKCRAYGIGVPDSCRLVFHMPMPASWSKSKRAELEGEPHCQTPDLDNLVKALLDAVLTDDAHVWRIQAEKRWSSMPGITVEAT